jgi:uncharacterized protein (TIGR01244 family)
MWPFAAGSNPRPSYRKVADDFAVGGQIGPQDIKAIADAGFKTVLCARPDNEEPGQPGFAEVAKAAERAGLKAVHIPVSGMLGEGQLIRMEKALRELPGPMFGYCRSGARAGSLYATARRAMR